VHRHARSVDAVDFDSVEQRAYARAVEADLADDACFRHLEDGGFGGLGYLGDDEVVFLSGHPLALSLVHVDKCGSTSKEGIKKADGTNSYIPILRQPSSLLRLPSQRRTPVAEQAEVDLRADVDCDDVQQLLPTAISYTAHFLVVCGPFLFRCSLEFLGVLEDLGPVLFAVFLEERGVEADAAAYLGCCGTTVLVAYLWCGS
jgi:hypothetical protein